MKNIMVFGIRHHGPGSANAILKALELYSPDAILLEGPVEGEDILNIALDKETVPPVAMLVYEKEKPEKSYLFPFAEWSPEWQTIKWAGNNNIPLHFFDLPMSIQFSFENQNSADEQDEEVHQGKNKNYAFDLFAKAAGYSDPEAWWHDMFEAKTYSSSNIFEAFEAVLLAMSAIREQDEHHSHTNKKNLNLLREAYMRECIRKQRKKYQKIAVICGAWHAPVLNHFPKNSEKDDPLILKNLPKTNVNSTWVPWTYERISKGSGYSAGVVSPQWYDFLWHSKEKAAELLIIESARLLRDQGLDASTANVIEAIRVSQTLAVMRERSNISLNELKDSIISTLCFGDEFRFQLIYKKLVIGEKLGEVPHYTPQVPLQKNISSLQKEFRLKPDTIEKIVEFDMREERGRAKSEFLRRLVLLGIEWGRWKGGGKCPYIYSQNYYNHNNLGTFKEVWSLKWNPEFNIKIVELARYGNTLESACISYISERMENPALDMETISKLLDITLMAGLTSLGEKILVILNSISSKTYDVKHLMGAIVNLVSIARYRNVREFKIDNVLKVISIFSDKITINLPSAICSIAYKASCEFQNLIAKTHNAFLLYEDEDILSNWFGCLKKIASLENSSSLINGFCINLLYESKQLSISEMNDYLNFNLNHKLDIQKTSFWIEGCFKNQGKVILYSSELFEILNSWILNLDYEIFIEILPLLRRTFSTWEDPIKRKILELIMNKNQQNSSTEVIKILDIDNTKVFYNTLNIILSSQGK